ncbi:hypothetical protein L1887_06635 [Cichorium endivia]|nr:hypothetical protein L1887_06635 [Cichorium endivia]
MLQKSSFSSATFCLQSAVRLYGEASPHSHTLCFQFCRRSPSELDLRLQNLLQQRLRSVSFQVKDQIGNYFYFPCLNFQRASAGFGSLIINPRSVIPIPFDNPVGDITILIGDWYIRNHTALRHAFDAGRDLGMPDGVLINDKGPYRYNNTLVKDTIDHETINVEQGRAFRIRCLYDSSIIGFLFVIDLRRLTSRIIDGDIILFISWYISRQKEKVDARLAGIKETCAGSKTFLDGHVSSVEGITTDAKRKWQEFYLQAENDAKDNADFSAAKHCRMELLLQKR